MKLSASALILSIFIVGCSSFGLDYNTVSPAALYAALGEFKSTK